MFYDFKEAVSNISNYNDILEVLILYYFDKNMLLWYKHLIDNKMSQKKQSQIGIFYDMPQSVICRHLSNTKKRIKLYTRDLDTNREILISILDYIDKNSTEVQKNLLACFLQRKSYSDIGRIFNISRQSVHNSIHIFFKHIKNKSDLQSKIFKKNLNYLYNINLTNL